MKNFTNTVELKKPEKSVFDLSHDIKMSLKFGGLYPVSVMEALPSDRFNISTDALVRVAPMIAPVMHRMDVSLHTFFVPNRILWENWEAFITDNMDDTLLLPYYPINSATTTEIKTFMDYFGVAPINNGSAPTININALPFAAYQCVYNEYYRDQNLITPIDYKLVNGNNSGNLELMKLRRRAWESDYFTANLPWTQKGDQVTLPLGTIRLINGWDNDGTRPQFVDSGMSPVSGPANIQAIIAGPNGPWIQEGASGSGIAVAYNPNGSLEVGATYINDLREAFRLQEFLERNAVGGTRYIEHLMAHFNQRSSDARLQRPQYICGVKSPIVVSEVLNTAGFEGAESALPQGNMAGHGVSVLNGNIGSFTAEEHGYFITIASVMPKTSYMQGIPRHFLKSQQFDFAYPTFAHLGEQPVLIGELYADADDYSKTFGYLPIYSHYRTIPSRVAGDFRTTLKYWHLSREFANEPELNQEFIECSDSDGNDRIFAVQDGSDYLYAQFILNVKALRPLPFYGAPRI